MHNSALSCAQISSFFCWYLFLLFLKKSWDAQNEKVVLLFNVYNFNSKILVPAQIQPVLCCCISEIQALCTSQSSAMLVCKAGTDHMEGSSSPSLHDITTVCLPPPRTATTQSDHCWAGEESLLTTSFPDSPGPGGLGESFVILKRAWACCSSTLAWRWSQEWGK